MRALQEFFSCFLREFRFAFPVAAMLLCMCLFTYSKSDIRRGRNPFSKIIFFLLCIMVEAVPISVALNAVAARTHHLPVRVMAISCVVLMWDGILFALYGQIRKKTFKKENTHERVGCN